MYRHKPDLLPLALDAKVHDALTALHIAQAQQAQLLFTADTVIEQGGKDGTVTDAFERIKGGPLKAASPAHRRGQGCCPHYYWQSGALRRPPDCPGPRCAHTDNQTARTEPRVCAGCWRQTASVPPCPCAKRSHA